MTQGLGFKHFSLEKFSHVLEKAQLTSKNILLSAPTGSGKSLYFPHFLSKKSSGKIIVLQPRRLAAKELARYFAKCLGEVCGESVGYKFRLEQKISKKSQIIFQTYGNHLQEILHGEIDADWVIFDEFHERHADMDLLLAYYLKKQTKENSPRVAVMSAKLDSLILENALNTKLVETGEPLYPVKILNQNPQKNKSLEENVYQALRTLERNGIWKTTLVFLPGKTEIRRTREYVETAFGKNVPHCFELYAGQTESIQEQIFSHSDNPRIIFTTNVAETSLTVPCVSGVIDSGYERTLEYQESLEISSLRLSRITLQNAIQRSGRAGRLQEGVCIRLWSKEDENKFQESIVPEIFKTKVQEILLKQIALSTKLDLKVSEMPLLSPIPEIKAQIANKELLDAGFIQNEKLTSLGKEALEVPLENLKHLEAFLKIKTRKPKFLAMLSWLDSGKEFFQREKNTFSLEELANNLLEQNKSVPKEVQFVFEKLQKISKVKNFPEENFENILPKLLKIFPENIAIKQGDSFKLQNKQILRLKENEKVIMAFGLLKTENLGNSELKTETYLKIPESLILSNEDSIRYELLWQNSKECFIGIEIRESKNTEVSRKEIIPQEANLEIRKKLENLCSSYWKAKIKKENWSSLYETEEIKTLFCKMQLAAKYFPEYQFPLWNEEDLELIQEEFFCGIFLKRDLTKERYEKILKEYFGIAMLPWLNSCFPDSTILKSGKKAKYIYQDSLVEISARLSDFIENRGKHFIAEGKVPVRYDILAPNFRTVQKTWDLDGFWENTYPEIRKELRGRYPKHPWPEKIL